jgi:Mycobacterium membrane protein
MRVSGDTSRAGDPYTTTDQRDPGDDGYGHDGYADYHDTDYHADYDDVVYYEDSTHWRWVAGIAGAVLVLAVIGTVVILRGGDSATTTGRIQPSAPAPVVVRPSTTAPRPAATTPSTSLPPETMTTVTPSATTPTEAAPPPTHDVAQRTITYTISGTRQPGDFVTVTYIDGTGAPRTDFNVTLPWTKTVTPGGDMMLKSVTAVSLASHLNCSITDANGRAVATQVFNTIATTCNR